MSTPSERGAPVLDSDESPHVAAEESAADEACGPTFFAERDEVAKLLRELAVACPPEASEVVGPGAAAQFAQLETILVRYQEAPHLIKHHLGDLLGPLVDMLIARMPTAVVPAACTAEGKTAVVAAAGVSADAEAVEDGSSRREARLGCNYDEYDVDAPKSSLHSTARAIYFVAKVAGAKGCTSHFPHEVKHLEDVVYALLHWQRLPSLHREWEVRYCLLLWLSNLILVPFSLASIDSSTDSRETTKLSEMILNCALSFLSDPSKCREGAALLIARMMARPDAHALRTTFFSFAKATIAELTGEPRAPPATAQNADGPTVNTSAAALLRGQFLPGGVLLAVATAFKLGKRDELLQFALELIPVVAPVALTFKDTMVCKTAVKTVQRMGLAALRQRSAPWKYRKQVHSLEVSLRVGVPYDSLGATVGVCGAERDQAKEKEEEEDEAVPEVIEDVIDVLLRALSHSDTIVRWSAAKGIGRVCDRLGKSGADDVLQAILDTPFEAVENDSGWHGGCLALAEQCRRSTLLPARFADVVPIVSKALLYDVSRGSYSVGSHVRDAACYVCWSVARAYDAADLLPYVRQLSQSLVVAALFDREVNVRRASAAAFQECVGRLGNFPNGIALITTMDFFSLSSLKSAYLHVAPIVGAYETYRQAMIDHLVGCKLLHWDRHVRRTAASSLGKLSVLNSEYVLGTVLPQLLQRAFDAYIAVRHGAIFALAEIVANQPATVWEDDGRLAALIGITPTLESRRLFRGRGGEFVRQACCALLAAIARCRLPIPEHIMVEKVSGDKSKAMTHGKIQQFFDDTMRQPLEWLQDDCIVALGAYSDAYHQTFTETFHAKMLAKTLESTAENKPPNERRGCALALGAFSRTLLCVTHAPSGKTYFQHHIDKLCELTRLEQEKDAQDAEARRNAVRALRWLCTGAPTAAAPAGPAEGATLTVGVMHQVADALVAACDDYAVDKRGDVGSFVRIEAMQALQLLALHCLADDAADGLRQREQPRPPGERILDARVATQLLTVLFKQLVEKIDRVRGVAGSCLHAFFDRFAPLAAADPAARALIPEISVASAVAGTNVVDWSSPAETFPCVVPQLLHSDVYGPPVVEGLVVSIGGLSVHVLKASWAALMTAINEGDVAANIRRISRMLVDVMKKYEHSERMIVPIVLTVDKLMSAGKLDPACAPSVVAFIQSEARHFSADIQKLLSLVPLVGSLCRHVEDAAVREAAWHVALTMIAGRYPKVRGTMGAELYTSLLVISADSAFAAEGADISRAMEKLAGTQWDDPNPALVRGARDELFPLLGLRKPAVETGDVGARPKARTVDGTYAALVHEAGY